MERARPATEHDLPRIRELGALAVEELGPTRGGDLWIRVDAYSVPLERALGAADHLVVVGLIDDAVLGFAQAHARAVDGDTIVMLDALYVEPEARSVGIGEALMRAVVDWCHSCDAIGVGSIALPGNRAAKNFFETFGLTARAILVHQDLTESSGQ